jgi:MFS family permease
VPGRLDYAVSVLIQGALARLFVALFFSQAAFNVYWAALPLYFADHLGFDPTAIGLLIGGAGVAELCGALVVGPAIDRLGCRALLLAGIGCYLVGSLGYLAMTAFPALLLLRLIQGAGLSAVIPSAYSFVPHLIRSRRQTLAFASLGSAGNVAQAVFPLLGLFLLQTNTNTLFVIAALCAVLAGAMVISVPAPRPSRRPFGLTFSAVWVGPLAVGVLSVTQWGVITTFLPLAASEAGANPALLFTADAISVLTARIPTGWIADRYGPLRLALLGVICMALSPLLLLLPLNDGVLIAAGILNGAGAGLTLPPMLSQLSQRTDDARRGTALSYFSVSFALGIILGSSGGGLLYPWLQFHGLLSLGAVLCCFGLAALVIDAISLRRRAPALAVYMPLPTSKSESRGAPGLADSSSGRRR